MKCYRLLFLVLLILTACSPEAYAPRNGDIVFQVSGSAQSEAIQRATGCRYSHMGILAIREGAPFVYEAVGPVKLTPLREWVARGEGKHFVAKRLSDSETVLSRDVLNRMLETGRAFDGKPYDGVFEWSDDRVYCSELVWKIYKRGAGIEIGELQKLGDFDLSDPLVSGKVRERFGDHIPIDEIVISPAAMFDSPLLMTVHVSGEMP